MPRPSDSRRLIRRLHMYKMDVALKFPGQGNGLFESLGRSRREIQRHQDGLKSGGKGSDSGGATLCH
jgi:hypothetical protein